MGASAGGLEALTRVIGRLSPSLGASVFVVLHIAATTQSALPAILDRAGALPVRDALDGERFEPGHVYVAPPNHHLEIERDVMHLSQGPRVNGHRPAIDPLLRSAARAYGPHVAGVLLSGTLDDGTLGLREVQEAGGVAIVQDPDTALYPGMPRSAMRRVPVDAVLSLEEIALALARICDRAAAPQGVPAPVDPPPRAPEAADVEPTRFSCPDCGGPLWEQRGEHESRFRCAIGHAYSLESLHGAQTQQLEAALWAAVRLLEDRAVLLRRMGRAVGEGLGSRSFELQAQEASERAQLLRGAVEQGIATPQLLDDGGDVAPA